jgi:ribosome maturation factor RimP
MAETKTQIEPFVKVLDEKSEELRSIVEPAIAAQGCTLVDLHLLRGNRNTTVRLFVDTEGAETQITLKELELLNRLLGDLLDVEDGHRGLFRGTYNLEVSSPGVDRPLAKRSHFEAARGERVKVKTRVKVAGGKSMTGTLKSTDDEGIVVEVDAKNEHKVRWPEIDSAHTIFQFAQKAAPQPKRRKRSKKA